MSLDVNPSELGLSQVEKLSSITRRCEAGPNSVRQPGEYFVAIEPNSFGLPSVDTCPGRTDYCEQDCYAIESERRTSTYQKLQRNFDVLQGAESIAQMTNQLWSLMGRYHDRADSLGIPNDTRRFRIHWSGDFYSVDYASAWRNVIEGDPDTQYFTYTRSFHDDENVAPVLAGIPNLDFFLSVDSDNIDSAVAVASINPEVRIAYLVDYYEEVEDLVHQMSSVRDGRIKACPENMRTVDGSRRLALINENGGACSRCMYCIKKPNDRDVVFVKTGQLYRQQGMLDFPEAVPVEIKHRQKGKTRIAADAAGKLVLASEQRGLF